MYVCMNALQKQKVNKQFVDEHAHLVETYYIHTYMLLALSSLRVGVK